MMRTLINHDRYYNVNAAINRIKIFFKSSDGAILDSPQKPSESKMIDVVFPEAHFAVTFEPTRIVIESTIDPTPDELIAQLDFLATESKLVTAIFDNLSTISEDYRHTATVTSTPELSIVRFEMGETTAMLQCKTVGNKIKLLLEPVPDRPLDEAVEQLIKIDFTDVEKVINK